jgi:hypothetical protein
LQKFGVQPIGSTSVAFPAKAARVEAIAQEFNHDHVIGRDVNREL